MEVFEGALIILNVYKLLFNYLYLLGFTKNKIFLLFTSESKNYQKLVVILNYVWSKFYFINKKIIKVILFNALSSDFKIAPM